MTIPTDNETGGTAARILVVDDYPDALELMRRHLEPAGHRVFTASGVPEAISVLHTAPIDLVVTDMKMPQFDGLEMIRHVRENYRDVGIIMATGYPSIESAVESVKIGADDYLAKPFTRKELLDLVEEVLAKRSRRLLGSGDPAAAATAPEGLIGQSPPMLKVYETILKAAVVKATVLITGESGTGKEVLARHLHARSRRAAKTFVGVNCASLPETLLESELFGHKAGAFTGAVRDHPGLFSEADGGTLFLDEIGEI